IRAREFTMLDSYSLDPDEAHLDKQYRAHYQAYFDIFHRCGVPVIAVRSDVGMMGGSLAHEYMYLTPIGEDSLLLCDKCGYAANRQIARFRKPAAAVEEAKPVEKVATPHTPTIEALAELLGVTKARTAKAVFMVATVTEGQEQVEKFVFAVVRGDMDVNETKLANAVKARELRPAREAEIVAAGAVPGYASPMGLDPKKALVVIDEAVAESPNLVAGANEAGFHNLNVNYGRDFQAAIVTDLAAAAEGDACPNCGQALRMVRGVETGNIFKLGTRYTKAMGATFIDRDGTAKPVIMGSYGIGSGRLLACVAEEHHDADGLCWPVSVAPYHVQLTLLPDNAGTAAAAADKLYADLQAAGVEVLYDDRDERAGVKFKDADLIGLPIRVTVSDRSLKQGGTELKRRDQAEREMVPMDGTVARVQAILEELRAGIAARVVSVAYPEDV
ncbi:MAG: proline--tRNA ligase, partial [Anaerolineales bacterium]